MSTMMMMMMMFQAFCAPGHHIAVTAEKLRELGLADAGDRLSVSRVGDDLGAGGRQQAHHVTELAPLSGARCVVHLPEVHVQQQRGHATLVTQRRHQMALGVDARRYRLRRDGAREQILTAAADKTTHCWRRGAVVSGVRRMNEVNARQARLVPGWVTVFGGYTISVCNQPTRSTQPCIPTGSLNRVSAS